VQSYPERFSGALSMCGAVAGSVGRYNERLDHAFVLKTLLGFDAPLVNIGFGQGQGLAFVNRELEVIDAAERSAPGRARLALAEAMVDTPDWVDPLSPAPSPTDYATRQYNQYLWSKISGVYQDGERNRLEARIGELHPDGSVTSGNFSWNTDVDYHQQLARSAYHDLVAALYDIAGLDLEDDLDQLEEASRIAADSGAVSGLIALDPIFSGDLSGVPVVTLHTLGDGYLMVNQEEAYGRAVSGAGNSALLRQLYVARGGHCQFTSAEMIAAIKILLKRVSAGSWPTTASDALNTQASVLGPLYNKLSASTIYGRSADPRFLDYPVPEFLRPFDMRSPNPYP
ncbi:MAG: hypothetical protein LC808_08880, partial [Actinobacteria bacterium]|nr:hypothetical protein [Actinomycetota bacterium]